MSESLEAIAEKATKLAKSPKSTTNKVINSNVIPHRDEPADKVFKVNNIVQNFCKEDDTIKFMYKFS